MIGGWGVGEKRKMKNVKKMIFARRFYTNLDSQKNKKQKDKKTKRQKTKDKRQKTKDKKRKKMKNLKKSFSLDVFIQN